MQDTGHYYALLYLSYFFTVFGFDLSTLDEFSLN